MTLVELKAQSFDIISQIEYLKGVLQQNNQEIAKLQKEEQEKETLPAKEQRCHNSQSLQVQHHPEGNG